MSKKTKELIVDFRTKRNEMLPLKIKNETVEIVESYKYLGVTIDNKLDWHDHSSIVFKKFNQRLFFLRKLNSFSLDKKILSIFYSSVLESILTFCLTCWGGNCTEGDKIKFDRIIRKASKLTNNNFLNTNELFEKISLRKIHSIISDFTHPLTPQIRQSKTRPGRYIYINTKRERYKNSFLPSALKLLTLSNR